MVKHLVFLQKFAVLRICSHFRTEPIKEKDYFNKQNNKQTKKGRLRRKGTIDKRERVTERERERVPERKRERVTERKRERATERKRERAAERKLDWFRQHEDGKFGRPSNLLLASFVLRQFLQKMGLR